MKILFYNPAPSQSRFTPFEAMRGSPFFRRPNYDALRLAHLSEGHGFVYCDEHIETLSDIAPDIVVIHVPLNLARHVENFIAAKWHGESILVCYGSYPTLFPKGSKEFCTSVVVGDIAAVWKQILSDCRKKKPADVYRSDRTKNFAVDRRLESKFGFTPFYSQIRTSYGCQCTDENKDYCYENIMYKIPVRWNLEKAVEAIGEVKRKAVFVLDDDFLFDMDYGIRLLEKCWRHKKMWIFQTTSEIFKHPKIFPILRDDGVRIIYLKEDWFGRNVLQEMNNEDYIKEKEYQINMIHNHRITAGCKIRLGFEGENHKAYQRLMKLLVKLRIDIIELAVQTPLPGTKTYRRYESKNQILSDLSLYDQWMPVVNIPGMAPQALYSMMEWLRDSFYSWDSIMLRQIIVSPRLGFYNTIFFYLLPNISYRSNFLEKVGYPP
jgi:radical SAM superfamily enzyme YgiQ (UPF0313 family)